VSTRSKAPGDPAKKSFDDTEAFVEILAGVKSLDMALEVQKEFTKSVFGNFVGGSAKIENHCGDLARQYFKPLETSCIKAYAIRAATLEARLMVIFIKASGPPAGLFIGLRAQNSIVRPTPTSFPRWFCWVRLTRHACVLSNRPGLINLSPTASRDSGAPQAKVGSSTARLR
jgi:hypothetical protein